MYQVLNRRNKYSVNKVMGFHHHLPPEKKRDLLAITSDRLSVSKDTLWAEASLPSPPEEVMEECDHAFTVGLQREK